ncbi:hypothetical protein DV737_g2465, partial [Chaetothyriales sp. CBS 132003]
MPALKGQWQRLTSHAEPFQRSSQCLSVVGDTAYIFGGELEPRIPRDNKLYAVSLLGDGDVDQEQARLRVIHSPQAPAPRVGAASTSIGSKVYYFGGRGGPSMACLESKGALEVFDTESNRWDVLTPASETRPEDRSYHSMASDTQKTIYVHAGCPAQGRLHDLWSFDISTREWKQLASAPGGGRGGTSIAYGQRGEKKLYRVNGFDGKTEQGGSVDVYDVDTNQWSSINYKPDGTQGPERRSVAALVAAKSGAGKEYLLTLFGEGAPSDLGHAGAGRMFNDVWAFDLEDSRWLRVESDGHAKSPLARGWFAADTWRGAYDGSDAVVVQGGLHDDNSRLGDVWILQLGD